MLETVGSPLASYPHAKIHGNMIFLSGCSSRQRDGSIRGVTPNEHGSNLKCIAEQTRGCIENMKTILEECDCNLSDLLEITVFLVNMQDYQEFNKVYNEYFNIADGPARTCVEVSALPGKGDLLIEMRAIARVDP